MPRLSARDVLAALASEPGEAAGQQRFPTPTGWIAVRGPTDVRPTLRDLAVWAGYGRSLPTELGVAVDAARHLHRWNGTQPRQTLMMGRLVRDS
jgi:hypothetical protein